MRVRVIAISLLLLLVSALCLFRFVSTSEGVVVPVRLNIEMEVDHEKMFQSMAPGETKHIVTRPLRLGGEPAVVIVYTLTCILSPTGERIEDIGLSAVLFFDGNSEIKRVIDASSNDTDPEELQLWYERLENHLHPPRTETPWIAVSARALAAIVLI